MGYEGRERRKFPRSKRGFRVAEPAGDGLLTHVENISANGVLAYTVKPIPSMTIMGITLDLPKPVDRRIEAEGVVVRCDPEKEEAENYQVAILFTRMSANDRAAVESWVHQDLQVEADTD